MRLSAGLGTIPRPRHHKYNLLGKIVHALYLPFKRIKQCSHSI